LTPIKLNVLNNYYITGIKIKVLYCCSKYHLRKLDKKEMSLKYTLVSETYLSLQL